MLEYTNRKGVVYHLHRRQRKDGVACLVMTRSPEGAERELPPGYEIVENVNGQVSVRALRPGAIHPDELAAVRAALAKCGLHDHRAEVKARDITIFEPNHELLDIADRFSPFDSFPGDIGPRLMEMLRERFGDAALTEHIRQRRMRLRAQFETRMHYEPVMRFRLVDAACREFQTARMTYSGRGGWRSLGRAPLPAALRSYVRHIGRDTFFELT